jgi:hypothetical protein
MMAKKPDNTPATVEDIDRAFASLKRHVMALDRRFRVYELALERVEDLIAKRLEELSPKIIVTRPLEPPAEDLPQ